MVFEMNEIFNGVIVYIITGTLGFVAVFIFRINSSLAVIKESLDDLKEDKKSMNDRLSKIEIEIALIKQNCQNHEKKNYYDNPALHGQ